MKKITAAILSGLIIALPLYGCNNIASSNDGASSAITASTVETDTSTEEAGTGDLSSSYNEIMSATDVIELAVKNCMVDIVGQYNETYNGTSTYTDALGIQHTVPNASVVSEADSITIEDVAGINQINELFSITHDNTEFNPYWRTTSNICIYLDSEGNSIDGDSYKIDGIRTIPLTKNGIPDPNVCISDLYQKHLELNQ